jgi:hypothetical protein
LSVITVNAISARIPAKAALADLSKTDWAVLHAICLHVDREGRAFPSMTRISEIAQIWRNHVPRSVARLEKQGLLRCRRVPRPTGGWQANHYEIIYEPIGDVTTTGDALAPDVTPDGDTKAEMSPTEVTGVSPKPSRDVTSIGALTGQEEHIPYQKDGAVEVKRVNGAGVPSAGDTPICRWPLGTGCDKPALPGQTMCARHG